MTRTLSSPSPAARTSPRPRNLRASARGKRLSASVREKKLSAALDALAHTHNNDADLRAAALALLKQVLADGHAEARHALETRKMRGAKCAEHLAQLMDDILRGLACFTEQHILRLANPTDAEKVTLIAVGGYGRARLAPHSDIDLLFLLPYKRVAAAESFVEYMLYMLWDMGLKVGYATRTVPESLAAAREDMTVRTALLENRLLWGGDDLYARFQNAFLQKIVARTPRDFVAAKLDERDMRHKRAGRSRYLVEPDVKEGKGGLRDLDTLFWIARYSYQIHALDELVARKVLTREELHAFRRCEAFLWEVRCHLHFLAGRAQERLSFDVQKTLAARMMPPAQSQTQTAMKPVEQFMRRYFLVAKNVGDLTAIFCASLEAAHKKSRARLPSLFRRQKQVHGLVIAAGRLHQARTDCFVRHPINFIRIFYLADMYRLDIHPDTLRAMTQQLKYVNADLRNDKTANDLFLKILTSRKTPERILRRMNEVGVLGRFIPAFGRIVALMQFNMYHHYTADEHLLRAVGLLGDLEKDKNSDAHSLAHNLLKSGQINRRVLYLAVLLHDIAKGRPEDHSIAGARIARQLSARFGFSKAETELTAWLVREHLLMSDVAQRRDLSDVRTIQDFAARVQTTERLKHLLVLTQVDIQAVGPGVWTRWKAELLRTLYYETEAELAGTSIAAGRGEKLAQAHAAFAAARAQAGWSPRKIKAYIARHAPNYWLSFPTDAHLRHADMLAQFATTRDARAGKNWLLDITDDDVRDCSCLTFIGSDHAGLFARLSGACAVAGLTILDARIMTTQDGLAVDTLYVQHIQDGHDRRGRALEAAQRRHLKKIIGDVLAGDIMLHDVGQKTAARKGIAAFDVAPYVRFHNDLSDTASVIEVSALDRPGLLHALVRTLFHLNITISAARIATFGERGVDVFYVHDLTGDKITAPARIARISQSLRRAIDRLFVPAATKTAPVAASNTAPRARQANQFATKSNSL